MGQKTSYEKGMLAEKKAEILLCVKGYKILETRYKTRFGEIDIIARKKNTLVFVEVKARSSDVLALEAVSPQSQARISNAAAHFLAQYDMGQNYECRFDVVTVLPFKIPKHYKNMWHL